MTTPFRAKRRYLASSPFQPEPEREIEQFAIRDRVSHDSYGVGRVITAEPGAVTVDFGSQTVRIVSPFDKMEKL